MNIRIVAVGAMSAALIAGGATAASAAAPAQNPFDAGKPARTISISASSTHVRAGQSVTLSGSTSGLQKGSTVTIQEQVRGRWVSQSASSTVSRSNAYKVTDRLTSKGRQTLRVVDGSTVSPSVSVVVS
jgi:hypothetical protein